EDGIRDFHVTGVQTCALPIYRVDVRLDLAGELLEHEVLVLHLGREAGRLEEPLLVRPVVVLGPGELVARALGRPLVLETLVGLRSEERRVGKAWRCRRWARRL